MRGTPSVDGRWRRSDKPKTGYTYDTLAEDLHSLVLALDLQDASLVGFSMGGGEVARYLAAYGPERVRSVVFAATVTPYLEQTSDNPDGPVDKETAATFAANLTKDQDAFYDEFTTQFFSVDGVLKVTEAQRQEALALARQADKNAALQCMTAWGTTDFRDDPRRGRRQRARRGERGSARPERQPRRRVQPGAAAVPGPLTRRCSTWNHVPRGTGPQRRRVRRFAGDSSCSPSS